MTDLVSAEGHALWRRIAGRNDPTKSALANIISREVEKETAYNAPQYAGTTNPEQPVSAGDHTHGTPDGSICLMAASICASVRDAEVAVYIPDGWESHPGLIRGSLREWELLCYPLGAELSFEIHFPGFTDGRRTIAPYDLVITRAVNGQTGTIAGGGITSSASGDLIGNNAGQNITDNTHCDVVLTANGSGPEPRTNAAQGCTLNLHGHRNRTYAGILLPQIDQTDDGDTDDLPDE